MAKATKKSAYPAKCLKPSTSKVKSKNVKTRREPKARMADKMDGKPRPRSSRKLRKITKKCKKSPPSIPKRKVSEKTTTSTKKNKKVHGKQEIFGHYHQLMEELTKTDPDQSRLDSFSTETNDVESQYPQNATRNLALHSKVWPLSNGEQCTLL